MKKLFVLILISFISLPALCSIFSDEEPVLYAGDTRVVKASNPTRIAIGKPEVIDVVRVSDKEIVLIAKGKGETTFVWWDIFGEHSLYFKVYPEDMSRVKEHIDTLIDEVDIEGIYTRALDSEGKVLLFGEVKTQGDKDKLFSILGELKAKTQDFIEVRAEDTSIEIEVNVLELTAGLTKNFGLSWPQSMTLDEPTRFSQTLQGSLDAMFRVSDWTRGAFQNTLNFAIAEGKARVLSRPRLVCRSGTEASLLIGGEQPVLTTQVSEGSSGTSVEYKEYGINLKIKPTIIDDDKIDLDLDVDVSELQEAEVLGTESNPTAKAYPVTKRTVKTELSLNDGQTLFIGGLIKEKTAEDLTKFPWLADIPVLGAFFRQKNYSEGGGSTGLADTELFITLTPTIIRTKNYKIKDIVSPDQERVLYKKGEVLDFYERMNVPDDLKGYIYKVQEKILSNISYPSMLIHTGWEASLVVSLKLSSTGELKDVKIVRPSGYKIFDDQTIGIVRKLSYPPFPSHIRLEEINIEVPIAYRTKK